MTGVLIVAAILFILRFGWELICSFVQAYMDAGEIASTGSVFEFRYNLVAAAEWERDRHRLGYKLFLHRMLNSKRRLLQKYGK